MESDGRTSDRGTPSGEVIELARVSVCICTYRRPDQLAALLTRLASQVGTPGVWELVVVDNDAAGSAQSVVEGLSASFPVRYEIQPVKNISLTRNRALALARGNWIGFLDDDELPEIDWLARMFATAVKFDASGVMAPVLPVIPATAQNWLRRGNFYTRPRHATGAKVPRNELRTGNALVARSCFGIGDEPFDPAFGLTGGGDSALLSKLSERGARFVWCDDAPVTEPVPPERLRLSWLLRRAYRGGQGWARQELPNGLSSKGWTGVRFVLHSSAALVAALFMTLALLPFGRMRWVGWLRTVCAQAGKLTALPDIDMRSIAEFGRELIRSICAHRDIPVTSLVHQEVNHHVFIHRLHLPNEACPLSRRTIRRHANNCDTSRN